MLEKCLTRLDEFCNIKNAQTAQCEFLSEPEIL
jgi:hypothetical protein